MSALDKRGYLGNDALQINGMHHLNFNYGRSTVNAV